MRPLTAVLIVLALLLGFWAFLKIDFVGSAAKAQARQMASAFKPNTGNQTVVGVYGWHEDELAKILADFRSLYGLPSKSDWVVTSENDGHFSIKFSQDIEPKLLYFLINYIRYPRGLDLKGRTISVVGHVILSPAFGIPKPILSGRRAVIFIPENDTEYDFVCAWVDNEGTYKIPFTDLIWQPAENIAIPTVATRF